MKTAIIDPGGGMKGAFSAGVTDGLLDAGISFDLYLGVSAGAANLASYACRQRGRNHAFYLEYARRKQYMSVSNFIHKGSYFDFDYIFTTLTNSNGENALDYEAFIQNPADFISVATNAITGRPVYLGKNEIRQDQYDVFKATCSIPWLCSYRLIRNLPMVDGTVSDPLPITKALEKGADRIVVILPSELEEEKENLNAALSARFLSHSRKTGWMPGLEKAMKERPKRYNQALALMKKMEKDGTLYIVRPSAIHHVTPLTRDRNKLKALYQDGLSQSEKIARFLHVAPQQPQSVIQNADL